MSWQTDTINPAVTSPAVDITKITNDLQVLRDTFNNVTDPDVPVVLDATKLVGQVPVESLGLLSGRNRLINAQGLINQRGYVSGTATTTANQYTVDRWRVVTSGQNLTFTTTNNEVTFTAPAGGVEQVIEGLNLESGTYALNWEGTATATVGGTAVAKGGTVTVVGGTNTAVRFIGGTFIRPQFEAGSVATPFERRPFGTELALCQRYYEKSYNDGVAPATATAVGTASGQTNASNVSTISIRFKVDKRTTPTVTIFGTDGTAGFVTDNINRAGTPTNTGATGTNIFWGGNAAFIGYTHYVAVSEL